MTALLEATGLVKVYRSARGGGVATTALAGVSLALEPGCCLGIVGESGCGKSTLARLLIGLERPTTGTIRVRGHPWTATGGPSSPGCSSSSCRIRSPRSIPG